MRRFEETTISALIEKLMVMALDVSADRKVSVTLELSEKKPPQKKRLLFLDEVSFWDDAGTPTELTERADDSLYGNT